MIPFKQFITESDKPDEKTHWMSGKELSQHIPKTAHKHIANHSEHQSLQNHNIAHGGNGDLHYRIHTTHYTDKYKTRSVQAASSKKDKDGYTHHATFDLHNNSAKYREGSHEKTNAEKKITLPWHTSDEKTKEHEKRAGN